MTNGTQTSRTSPADHSSRRPLLPRLMSLAGTVAVAAIMLASHVYLLSLLDGIGLSDDASSWIRGGVWCFSLSLFYPHIASRCLPRSLAQWVVLPACLWMGFAFLLIHLLFAWDFCSALLVASGVSELSASADYASWRSGLVIGSASVLSVLALWKGTRFPAIRTVEIELDRWPRTLDGFTIAQLSDVHIGALLGQRFARQCVRHVHGIEPDMIAITGDLVDGRVECLANQLQCFSELTAPAGVYFVTGNHDHYSGAESWVSHIRGLGIEVLRNEHRRVTPQGGEDASFIIAGCDDRRSRRYPDEGGEDLNATFRSVPKELALVLLAHDPNSFKDAAGRVDLQLSGHTHGGQLFPFVWAVRLVTPFIAGLYRRGKSQLYVSSGTGYWGPPMRLGPTAEITAVVLRSPEGSP